MPRQGQVPQKYRVMVGQRIPTEEEQDGESPRSPGVAARPSLVRGISRDGGPDTAENTAPDDSPRLQGGE
jgi:hypothetical protein